MVLKITKDLPYQILFALCVLVTYLNIYELTFLVWAITLAISFRKRYSVTIFKYVMCFVGIFVIAFIVAFFRDQNTYNYIRDITYLVKPILGLLVGYQLCRSHDIKPFQTILYTGLLISSIHLFIIFYSAIAYRIINIHDLRFYGGYFGDFEFYALLIAIFNKELEVPLTKKAKRYILLVIGLSAFFYLSRINFIQFAILYLVMKGYFRLTTRNIIVMGSMLVVLGAGYSIIYNMHLTRNGKGVEAFLYKIKNAPIEAFKTKINKDDYEDFNDNYRSYENLVTVRQVAYEGTSAILFGKGMGATIDLGMEIWTNDLEFIRYIPVLHNGLMTVYLKSGFVGVFLNLAFLYFLYRQRKSDIPLVQNINLFLMGTAIYLLFANWVLLGLYLKTDSKSIIIGFILCYKEIVTRKYLASNAEN